MTGQQFEDIEAFAAAGLATLEAKGIRRSLLPAARNADGVTRNHRRLISFCDNDYLGLSQHSAVIRASIEATREFGAGAGAARLVTGDNPLNQKLETRLAQVKGLPAARVFGSGYLANIGVIPVLASPGDLIAIDELSHACMFSGAKLSGAEVAVFPHNDVAALARLLANRAPGFKALVLTETVFSMDGDLAPLDEIQTACRTHRAWLMTDDAHGLGVLKRTNPAPIQMGTLSKAAGAYGGYIAGPSKLIELITSRARSFVYTTGLPPGVLAAALAALDVMEAAPELGARAVTNARLFASLIGRDPASVDSAIVPVILGDSAKALEASERLEAEGFLVTAIRPPTVPAGTARLRVTFSARHQEQDVRRLADLVRALLPAQAAAE
ncbi:MAG TPA: 8-amino-7-oxononanoate synthase [Hyphomonadaceae bacterium]|nr:8-amino-7-oxononanoate synthase [Hyphomonadaceae bacterium]